jgi:hypothetical protein
VRRLAHHRLPRKNHPNDTFHSISAGELGGGLAEGDTSIRKGRIELDNSNTARY